MTRITDKHIEGYVAEYHENDGNVNSSKLPFPDSFVVTDVLIAGSGPIG